MLNQNVRAKRTLFSHRAKLRSIAADISTLVGEYNALIGLPIAFLWALRPGASPGEIGELLDYHTPELTKIYSEVDLYALRALALPWPRCVMNTLREGVIR
jgi:hypothetical protein